MNMISEVADENSKSETTLGALINKCGKMRMLSHRVVLTLLVENSKTKACPEALNDVEKKSPNSHRSQPTSHLSPAIQNCLRLSKVSLLMWTP